MQSVSIMPNRQKHAKIGISVVIAFVLILQGLLSLRFIPRAWRSSVVQNGGYLWPFMTYGMYSRKHYEGDTIPQYVLVGVFTDATEVIIHPEDLGLNFWKFLWDMVPAIQAGDSAQVRPYLNALGSQQQRLARLRLEDHPLRFERGGVVPAEVIVVATVDLTRREKSAP